MPAGLRDWCGAMVDAAGSHWAADDARSLQLREGLAAVQARIARAVAACGRTGPLPELIVVTKFHPADDIRRLAALGVTDIGENRDQEAAAKAAELGELSLRWHFIGQLQSKKSKSVARYAHAVHSVDRPQLAAALAKAIADEQHLSGRPDLECFIQVSLDEEGAGHRGGAAPSDVPELAALVEEADGLRLAGVMAVAPLGEEPAAAFERLATVSAGLKAQYPHAAAISAGMSQDLEAAVQFGATHLRIGSDILGSRPRLG
jgi:PLP dependent protein